MKPKHARLSMIGLAILFLSGAVFLAASAFRDNIVFFHMPSDHLPIKETFRLGGLVEEGSVKIKTSEVIFSVTDLKKRILVRYKGLLPDLFKEGQGVVAEGRLNPEGIFEASSVLAKHDERYMPPDVTERLQEEGRWKP